MLRRKRALMGKVLPDQGLVRAAVSYSYSTDMPAGLTFVHPRI